ncbi:hypothetical protein EST38_g2452 [Candolleomyces aberdarensis]|uniref:SGF29 C-terminal domain-containing protein n=1 Tax=Candolleomyces aberdarensis TaxID=2316362 RepID=A0A4Q2DUI3_9AGAR|nr:hypothetical protein EST38_g2452 [Candolleomyces aberdarensis]
MDRRRGVPARPSTEEVECWTHAADSLRLLSKQITNHPPLDLVGRANRLITAWPTGDDLPGEGWKSLKENYKKLTNALEDIQKHSDAEVKLLDQSIEQLGVLMALRKAPETPHPPDKRNKRPRGSSPAGTPGPTAQSNGRGVSITLPPRTNSVGPSHTKKKEPRVHPLQAGRKIAFWNGASTNRGSGGDDADWILAIVIKVVSSRDGRYEVRDAEEQDGAESVVAPQKHIIPLPDPKSPILPEFQIGSTVLGLYPDTSCFYRADVVATPKSLQSAGRQPVYKLRFEDDDNQEHTVAAEWVVEYPVIK